MSLVQSRISLRADVHSLDKIIFGSVADLVNPPVSREKDTLIIACSELAAGPDCISFGKRERFLVLQHLAGSIPSENECEKHDGLSCDSVQQLFDKYEFRHVIVCGYLGCGAVARWLQPESKKDPDTGGFRRRFETGTRRLVDASYSPDSCSKRFELMIFEHVLCQIENLLTHSFVSERIRAKTTSIYGWVVDDESSRVYGYSHDQSAYLPI